MSHHPQLAKIQAEEAAAEFRERQKAARCPKAEALWIEALDRVDLSLLALWLAMRVEAGKELTPEEEAQVRERLDGAPGTGL